MKTETGAHDLEACARRIGDDLLVAAASESTGWARNLDANPDCHVELRGARRRCRAQRLTGAEAEAAVVALILKYGTPAERLSGGPAYRLSTA